MNEFEEFAIEDMLTAVKLKRNHLVSSEDRGIGKTYMLNQLCLMLQALGYKVCGLTPMAIGGERYVGRYISLIENNYRGMGNGNTVIVVDEVKRVLMDDIIKYCKELDIPIVGYVDFQYKHFTIPTKTAFETEYDASWINVNDKEDGYVSI